MKRILALCAVLMTGASIHAANVDVAANITTDTVWTSDNTYILKAQVYVVNGASLTIEPGTVVKGAALTDSAAALIVSRGSKIFALGSPSSPIIFTAESDPLDGSLDESNTQLWGGVIILGAAPINSQKEGTAGDPTATPPTATVDNIEGLQNSPDNDWTEFGGLDPADNSGVFRYVSIRFGGSVIGANNEINGLTMGGVGNGTLIEFVEVFANKDDGFEWFGGTVNARYLVSAFGNDDSFDYDEGWTGKGQFWFSIGTTGATSDAQDHGGEHDGTVDFSQIHPQRGMGDIYNATYIGPGHTAGVDEGVFEISDDAGVHYYNSIFMEWGGHGVDVLTDALPGLTEEIAGVTRIDFRNNIWWNLGAAGDVLGGGSNAAAVSAFLTATGKANTLEDPMLRGISRTANGGLDPRPAVASPAFSNGLKEPSDSWYIKTDYQGAFGQKNWLYGWTYLAQKGYLGATNEGASARPGALSANLRVPDGKIGTIDFAVYGDLPSMFLIRAAGPKLADYGVTAATMPDPMITVRNFLTGEVVAEFTGWVDRKDMVDVLTRNVGLFTLSASDGFATNDETSAVAIVSLNPGVYTVSISDEGGAGGFVQTSAFNIDL